MSIDTTPVPDVHDVSGPGRDALELLYRIVAAIELTPTVAVHAIDRNGIVRFWNNTCCELYGIATRSALGQPLSQLVSHREAEAEFAEAIEAIWQSGRPGQPRDWQVEAPKGRVFWVYSTIFPVHRYGLPQQLFCMDIDITARKREELALLHSGENFRQLFERSTDAIVLIQRTEIIDANPSALRLFHCTAKAEMVGRSLLDFSPAQQPSGESSQVGQMAMAAQTSNDGNTRYEWRFELADGSAFWADVLLTSLTLDHEFLSYAVIRDISVRKATEHTLLMAAQVFENCRDAIQIMDAQYRVVAVNQAFCDITGYSADEIVGQADHSVRSGAHDPTVYQQIWDYVAENDHWEGEIWSVRKNGQLYPVWAALTAIRDHNNGIANYMAILSDITERKRNEEKTRHLAEHDFLTDLPNRVLFLDRLHQAMEAARRKGSAVAVLFVDLDHFKSVNDRHGHHVGDLLLKEVAQRLSRCVRSVDTVSRQGGDEFVVILADVGGAEQAAHVAGSVMQAIAQVDKVGQFDVRISGSVGVSIYPSDGEDVDTLLKHADVAMYHAKQNGRNEFRFFSPEMNAHVVERLALEGKLRAALAHDQFLLEYQPEVEIGSGRILAVEALLRWRDPERGLLLPAQFIDVAEASGLMLPIGKWVLEQACLRARHWHDQGLPVAVAVNLSSAQFLHADLLATVDAALARSGLPPAMLTLEITEQVLMSGNGGAGVTLARLRERGVQLTVDKFGTGYSSLGFLRHFPLSKLKIDRSFVDDIAREPADAAIIPAIIALARSMHLRVSAEGVETAEQLRFLRQHGCDDYQGFFASGASSEPDFRPRHR